MNDKKRSVLFVWENFGPLHIDRVASCVQHFGDDTNIIAIELFSASTTYDWSVDGDNRVERHTIFPNKTISDVSTLRRLWGLIFMLLRFGRCHIVFCHYERLETFFSAVIMRLFLRRVYVMNVSKFDDAPRRLWRELIKWLFHLPYQGGISSGGRASEYMRFLGISPKKIVGPYNSLSIERFKSSAGGVVCPFDDRNFVVVSRFVEKKNLFLILDAFAFYRFSLGGQRRLVLIGGGILGAALKKRAIELQLDSYIDWKGFLQTQEVSVNLTNALALILVSKEEQFGNVVIEAMALGIPCIVSHEVGARDLMIRTNVNGYVVESDNWEGLARFMRNIDEDEAEWLRLSGNTAKFVSKFDSSHFASAVEKLIQADE